MLLYQLEQLDESKLQQLCNDLTSETLTLEFKREPPGKETQDKVEFLKDVAALANAEGGDLIFGIEEKTGIATRVHPIGAPLSADAEMRRLGQILDGGIEPRVAGIRFKEIPVSGGFVLILRIPRSYDGPHRISYNDDERFPLRSGSHISKMSYDQLKTAFDRTATLAERAKSFRRERLDAICIGQTPKQLKPSPLCVVHIIPLVSLTGRQAIDVAGLSHNLAEILFSEWGHNSYSLNLDGIVACCVDGATNSGTYGYNQIYRTGCTESVFCGAAFVSENKHIPSTHVTKQLRMVIEKNIKLLKKYGVSGPAVIGIAMLNVEGYSLYVGQTYHHFNNTVADRNSLILPEAWLESLDAFTNIDVVVKPIMDILWQSFGVERCLEYTNEGKWSPRQY